MNSWLNSWLSPLIIYESGGTKVSDDAIEGENVTCASIGIHTIPIAAFWPYHSLSMYPIL